METCGDMSVNVSATAHQLQRQRDINEHIFLINLELLFSVGRTSCDQAMQLRFWHHVPRSEASVIISKLEILGFEV